MRASRRRIRVFALSAAVLLLGIAAPGLAGAKEARGLDVGEAARGVAVRVHGAFCRARSGEGWRHATAFGATAVAAGFLARRRRNTG